MNIIVASVALVAGILVWWMAVRQLTTKPWQAQGGFDGRDAASQMESPAAARVGLLVFLAVATSFFALFISAYLMRMNPELENGMSLRDWRPVAEPWILWVNTGLLIAGSAGMQFASSALRRNNSKQASTGMLAGGVFAILFLGGQYLAWRQLQAAGLYADGNPANAFFYVLTALHGLHLLGGLCVLGWAIARMSRERVARDATRLSVELCTVYWHYLLIIWLILFGLLLIT